MSPKIDYNKKNKILSIRFSEKKSIDSDIQGNVVIDYSKDGKVVNIDIMNININNFIPIQAMKELSMRCRQKMAHI